MKSDQITLEKFDKLVLEGKATWWEMELPSGKVFFGEKKAKMLGYPDSDFSHYQDFTKLLHEDDYEKTMQAMRDHLEGKKELYKALYRIKHKDGHFINFYDCGKIVEKNEKNVRVMGFVMKVDEDEEVIGQMDKFKELILKGKPSMIELVEKIKS